MIEIIGRGGSRQAPNRDYRQWYISTACGDAPPPNRLDCVWNLHERRKWEDWFEDWPVQMNVGSFHAFALEYVAKYGFLFGSTASWMLIHAASLGFKEILLNGVDLDFGSYETTQRDSLMLCVGLVKGQGVNVRHVNSQYFKFGAYGLPKESGQPMKK